MAFAYGGVLLGVGYGMLYAVLHGSLQLPLPAVALLMVMCGQGCGTLDSIIMTVTRRNFPRDLALAFGLLKTFFGLAAGYMSVVYKALFAPNEAGWAIYQRSDYYY